MFEMQMSCHWQQPIYDIGKYMRSWMGKSDGFQTR